MEEPDFVREVSKGGMLCPLPRSKPEKFDLNFVKWDFEQLHRKYVEVEDVTRAEGLSREHLVLSMRFFSFYKHHDIKIFTPSSHTIIFYCARMGKPVFKCSRKKKGEKSGVVSDSVSEKAEVRSAANERFKPLYLKKCIETSGFNYYRQIPCQVNLVSCISYDSRDVSDVIHQVQEFAFSDDADFW